MKKCRKLLILIILMCVIASIVNTPAELSAASRMPKLNVRTLYITKASAYKLRVYNTLDNYKVLFESKDNSIVGISKAKGNICRVKPKASGNTTISAYVYDSDDELISTLTCKVIVSPAAASVKFNKKRYMITEGSSKKIKAIIKPNISNEMPLYSSDNPEIATVSSNGTVTAVSAGQTTIRASISNGRSSSYILIVARSIDNTTPQPDSPQTTAEPDSNRSHEDSPKTESHRNHNRDILQSNYQPLSTPVVTCDEY